VVLLLLDATQGVTDQEPKLRLHLEKRTGVVLAVNKWDTVE